MGIRIGQEAIVGYFPRVILTEIEEVRELTSGKEQPCTASSQSLHGISQHRLQAEGPQGAATQFPAMNIENSESPIHHNSPSFQFSYQRNEGITFATFKTTV